MVCLQSCQYTYFKRAGTEYSESFSTFLLTKTRLFAVDKIDVNFFVFDAFFCLLAKSESN